MPMQITPFPMYETKSGVHDLKSFEDFYETYKKHAAEVFEKDKYHTHLLALITVKRTLLLPFNVILADIMKKLGDRDENLPKAKDIAFGGVAKIAKELKAIGYVEVSEAWVMQSELDDGKPHEYVNRIAQLANEAGTLEKIPGRAEALCVRGLYGDQIRTHMWTIRRNGEEVFLVNGRGDSHELSLEEASTHRVGDMELVIHANAKEAGILKGM